MKTLFYALCACVGLAQARPVVIEEVSTLARPDASWTFFGRFGVAIDGDWALVSGERFVPDSSSSVRHEGAAFLYQRSGRNWRYVRQLGPVQVITDPVAPGLGMKDGVAVTVIERARVFERSGSTWNTSFIETGEFIPEGPDVEVDNGRVLMPYVICSYSDILARKTDAAWTIESFLFGQGSDCLNNVPAAFGDLQGERAAILNPDDPIGGWAALRLFRPGLGPGGAWHQFQQMEFGDFPDIIGPEVAIAGPYVAVTGRRERGTGIAYQVSDSLYAWANTGMQAVDSYLEPDEGSATALERAGALFAQRNYSFDRQAYVINLFRVNDDVGHSSTHVATLQTKQGTSVGSWIDTSGSRIIVSGYTGNDGNNVVRVFELPTSFETPEVQVHNFDASSAGAVWQRSPGSSFSVVTAGNTGVYRQSDTAGDAASWLPSSTARSQAIQAEVTIRSVVGADRWVGLMTRRADDSNYYYVTLRTSGTVQLRRRVGGVFTTLASAPATVTIGSKYRLRLESVGTVHRVYLNDRLVLTARDAALREGTAGVVMFRASADYDNIIVTPSPLTTIYTQNFSTADISLWNRTSGSWQSTGGVLRQTFNGDYARAFIGTPTDDQIVRARIRPRSFVAPGTWVGLIARHQDDRNYLYVSLVERDRISLWRRTNGMVTQIVSRPMTVTAGTWYDVRVEIVDGLTRVYVNNQLMLSTNADPGPMVPSGVDQKGRVGLVTFRATADFDDFRAYQP